MPARALALGAPGCRRTPLPAARCPPADEKVSVQESTSFVSLALPPRAGCLVDRPRWGAWIHCREEGLATRPWGRDQPRAEGVHSRAGLRASRSRPWGGRSVPPRGAGWHLCCSRSGDTRPCVGHGRREQSRSSAGQLSVSEEGQRAGCQRQHWGTAGHSRGPHTPALWLGPSSLCQPMAPSPQCSLGIAPHPKPLESDRPERRS